MSYHLVIRDPARREVARIDRRYRFYFFARRAARRWMASRPTEVAARGWRVAVEYRA